MRSPLAIPAGYRADLEGPPTAHPLPLLVPQIDADGNELSGIRLPSVVVPLATYTGWNFRSPSIGQAPISNAVRASSASKRRICRVRNRAA